MRRGLYRHGRQWGRRIYPTLISDQSTLNDTEIRISCPATGSVTIEWGDGTSSSVVCDGTTNTYTHTYTATGTYTIRVLGTIDQITYFRCGFQSWVSGDIASLSGMVSLDRLYLFDSSISGDISVLSRMASLNRLYLDGSSVSGDISALSGLTLLTHVYIYSTSISGDIASLSGLTLLRYLFCNETSISGDIASLSGLTLLNDLFLHSTDIDTYTSTALPAWPGCNIQIENLGLSSTEIDNFLIDLADGVGANGDLTYVAGNDARTSASDAAVTALSAAGWGGDIP